MQSPKIEFAWNIIPQINANRSGIALHSATTSSPCLLNLGGVGDGLGDLLQFLQSWKPSNNLTCRSDMTCQFGSRCSSRTINRPPWWSFKTQLNFQASRTSFTAASMPRFRSMGFIPATTLVRGSPNGQMGVGDDFSWMNQWATWDAHSFSIVLLPKTTRTVTEPQTALVPSP